MLWSFTRDQESLTVEMYYADDTREYVVAVIGASGVPEQHRFKTAESFRAWFSDFERNLMDDGWDSDGPA